MTKDIKPVTEAVDVTPVEPSGAVDLNQVNGLVDFEPVILAFCCNY